MDARSIVGFFQEVADGSPLPVMVYNFPGVAGGLDVDSEMLVELSAHRNISGVKLTCGGIGKVPRVVENARDRFAVLSGQIDWMGPAMAVGAVGAITGMANLHPRVSYVSFHCFRFVLCVCVCVWLADRCDAVLCRTLQPLPCKQNPRSNCVPAQNRHLRMGLCERRHQREQMGGCQTAGISREQLCVSTTASCFCRPGETGLDCSAGRFVVGCRGGVG